MSMNTHWHDERVRRLAMVLLVLVLMAGSAYAGYLFRGHRADSAVVASRLPTSAGSGSTIMTKARQDHAFVNDSFRIKILDVSLHHRTIAARDGHAPIRAKNGQFVLVRLTATNVSKKPAIRSATASQLVDAAGRTYNAGVYLGAAGQGIERYQQPGTAARGWIAFDVPATVHAVSAVIVQPDENLATTNVPTRVSLLG